MTNPVDNMKLVCLRVGELEKLVREAFNLGVEFDMGRMKSCNIHEFIQATRRAWRIAHGFPDGHTCIDCAMWCMWDNECQRPDGDYRPPDTPACEHFCANEAETSLREQENNKKKNTNNERVDED